MPNGDIETNTINLNPDKNYELVFLTGGEDTHEDSVSSAFIEISSITIKGGEEPEENITEIDDNVTIICPAEFTYNPVTEKCEFYPETEEVCSEGIYNPVTEKCEVSPETEEFDIVGFFDKTLFDIGTFEVKLWMIIVGVFLLLILIPRKR